METVLHWLFLIVCIASNVPSTVCVYGPWESVTGRFQKLHEHPQLKKCIETILGVNEYHGCRVSVHSGQCEGLKRDWALNQAIEQGYAYARRLSLKRSYYPLFKPGSYHSSHSRWPIPVLLEPGARIDISLKYPDTGKADSSFYMVDAGRLTTLNIRFLPERILVSGKRSGNYVKGFSKPVWKNGKSVLHVTKIFKFSVLIKAQSVEFLYEDNVVGAMEHDNLHALTQYILDTTSSEWFAISVQDLEFTGRSVDIQ